MQTAIISDVHANQEALKAVLKDVRRQEVGRIFCLGDLVGYSAFPRETLALLQKAQIPCVHGNHDLMAIGRLEPTRCGPNASRAIEFTRTILSQDEKRYLAELPSVMYIDPHAIAVHSTLGDCEFRLQSAAQYRKEFEAVRLYDNRIRIVFTGHTHVYRVIEITSTGNVEDHTRRAVKLNGHSFYFVNPGSVGHPRLSDYRASYAPYDHSTDMISFRRVAYDKKITLQENARRDIQTDLGPSVASHLIRQLPIVVAKRLRRGRSVSLQGQERANWPS